MSVCVCVCVCHGEWKNTLASHHRRPPGVDAWDCSKSGLLLRRVSELDCESCLFRAAAVATGRPSRTTTSRNRSRTIPLNVGRLHSHPRHVQMVVVDRGALSVMEGSERQRSSHILCGYDCGRHSS